MAQKRSPNSVRIRNSTAEFLTFAYQTGGDGVEVRVQDGTIWLSQKGMGLLFDTSSDNVGLHLKKVFKDGELAAEAVTEEFSVTASDGKTYRVKHYNLNAIIAVGYRVNSKRATAFRQWATGVLRDYTLRGYVLDNFLSADEREVLQDAGHITAEAAREHAESEFEKYRAIQDKLFQSDFDRFASLGQGEQAPDDEQDH